MKITREKRPDRVVCEWKDYRVSLGEDNNICILRGYSLTFISKSEIPNLIKALQEVIK